MLAQGLRSPLFPTHPRLGLGSLDGSWFRMNQMVKAWMADRMVVREGGLMVAAPGGLLAVSLHRGGLGSRGGHEKRAWPTIAMDFSAPYKNGVTREGCWGWECVAAPVT